VRHSWKAGLALALLLGGTAAHAQEDCDTPDDLCTGDPCVVGFVEVGDSCVLDFGTRALVIEGTLRFANSGELSLTAGTIQLTGRIQNIPGSVAGLGPRVTLAASGDIDLDGPIRLASVRGAVEPGELTIQAGGSLTARSSVTAMTSPTTIGWSTTNGDVSFTGRVNTAKAGGEISIAAGGRLDFLGTFRHLDRVDLVADGDVRVGGRMSARQALTADAGGMLTLETVLRDYGSDVTLRGDLGLTVQKPISVTPVWVDAGSATLESGNGSILVSMPVKANDVTMTAADNITIDALVAASPPVRSGGTIDIESTGGVINTYAPIAAQPGDGVSPGDGAGGQVRLAGTYGVAVHADVLVNAFPQNTDAPGGTVEIEGADVSVALEGAHFDADGHVPGPDFPGVPPAGFRFTATTGGVSLQGMFEARGGPSVIQITAPGDVDLAGDYRVAPNGCIGIDAGGTVTTGLATFDTPVVTTCP
jgi:hypothetical protein